MSPLHAVVPNRGVAAPKAGRPVGIPVVVERTADTKGLGQLESPVAPPVNAGQEHPSDGCAKAEALVRTSAAGAPNIVKLGEPPRVEITCLVLPLAYVASILISSPGAGREVLDLQRSHHRTAPLVFGVTGDFRQSRSERRQQAEDVVGSVTLMQRCPRSGTDPKPGRRGCCRRCPEHACRHKRWRQRPWPDSSRCKPARVAARQVVAQRYG